jgi:mitogen-activated protein kinase kinase kinase
MSDAAHSQLRGRPPQLSTESSDTSETVTITDDRPAPVHTSSEEDILVAGDDEDDGDGQLDFTPATVTTPLDDVPPLLSATSFSWGPPTAQSLSRRSLGSSNGDGIGLLTPATTISTSSLGYSGMPASVPSTASMTFPTQMSAPGANTPAMGKVQRPHAIRTPSNAYAPFVHRRPSALASTNSRQRTTSLSRSLRQPSRSNPNAEYRAQEKLYMQRIRQDAHRAEAEAEGAGYMTMNLGDLTPGLDFSSDDGDGTGPPAGPDEVGGPTSPLSASATGTIGVSSDLLDDDFEPDQMLYYNNDDMRPTDEEMKIPENRDRMEWHTMLSSVLTGDVINQEKKRIGGVDQPLHDETVKEELWLGLRAKCYGRSLQAQRKNVERGRADITAIIDSVVGFEVRGYADAGGKSAQEQVEDIIRKIEKMEGMYINHAALRAAHPRVGTAVFAASVSSSNALGGSTSDSAPTTTAYAASYEAIIAWHNTMKLIETELNILRKWVGNDELNFSLKPSSTGSSSVNDNRLGDEASFIERILKEDGLKSLQNPEGLLVGLSKVINQAKRTLISHAEAFSSRHLPPYLEELQTLINFPSRLVKEIISIRLSYAKKIRDFSTQPVMTTEQMIGHFQIILNLATRIKDAYNKVGRTEPGWDPPDCLEENFDVVVVDALKYYFKLLNWKLTSNKNAFKEAEIMEQEWEFSTRVGRILEGGDVEVAEQFRFV